MPIPSTGFLRIYPGGTNIIGGNWSVSGSAAAPSPLASAADLQLYYATRVSTPANAPRMQYITEQPAASGHFVPAATTYELDFDPDTAHIVFDPTGTPTVIDFLSASFPMGLILSSLRIWVNIDYTTGPSRDRLITDISLKYASSVVASKTPTQGISITEDFLSDPFVVIPILAHWSPIQVFNNFGFTATLTNPISALLDDPGFKDNICFIQCVYDTAHYSLTLDTPNALPGEIVQIQDANGNLDDFTSIKIYWDVGEDETAVQFGLAGGITIPTGLIYTFTPSILNFQLPTNLGIPYGGRRLMVTGVGNGTSFVGEFPIANLNVLLTNGSGVYQLERGKYNDTYYDRSTSPVTTVDIKIPSPGARTGYF